MEPVFPAKLNYVNASHVSPYGRIGSSWKRDGNKLEWNVEIPANTTATVDVYKRQTYTIGFDDVHFQLSGNEELLKGDFLNDMNSASSCPACPDKTRQEAIRFMWIRITM